MSGRTSFIWLFFTCFILHQQKVYPFPDAVAVAESKRSTINSIRRRLTQGYTTPDSSSLQGRRRRLANPSIASQIRVLVLLIKFTDTTTEVPPREYYEELFNGDTPSEVIPVGSVKQWLHYNSLGKYRVTFDVRDWEMAEHDEAYYAGNSSGAHEDLTQLYNATMNKFDAEGSIDWTNGYVDESGYLYHFVVLHSGIAAELNVRCLSTPVESRIWSHGKSGRVPWETWWVSKDFYRIGGWLITSAFDLPACASDTELEPLQPCKIGIISHEYCHGIGLGDFYDQGPNLMNTLGGLAWFDIMGGAQGWNLNASSPGYLSAFNRVKLGWIEPSVIEVDGHYALQSLEISSSCYKITHGYPEGEYLYIENKQPIMFDSNVPRGGIVIYHVDEKADGMKQAGYPDGPDWPAAHYSVAVVQADGLFQLEKGENNGDVGDFWIQGMTLASGGPQPNTDSYQGGIITTTGVSIEIVSSSGFIMVFQVTGIGNRGAGLPLVVDDSSSQSAINSNKDDGKSVNSTDMAFAWIISMLAGLSLMTGLVIFVFV